MKKVIFAISVLLLGFTVSAHADDGNVVGTCCTLGLQNVCCSTNYPISSCPGFSSWPGQNDCALCCPIPSVASNQPICADGNVSLTGQVDPPVYDSVKWTTDGNGTFVPDNALISTYTPGTKDIAAGSVTLTLTVTASFEYGICAIGGLAVDEGTPCPPASDSLKVTLNPLPVCTITLDPDAAHGSVAPGTKHTASVPSAGSGASYEWVITDENGNNLITSQAPYGNAATWMAPQHAGKVYINVKVTDGNGCSCTYDPSIEGKDKGILVLVKIPVPTLSGWGTAIFALLLAGLAIAVFRRRNAG